MWAVTSWRSILYRTPRISWSFVTGPSRCALVDFCARNLTVSSAVCKQPGIIYPHPLDRQWAIKRVIDPEQYTVDALPLVRTGGRGPDGKTKYKHVTRGLTRPWFMVDYNYSRHLPTGKVQEELVLRIIKNWWRHPLIALVASGEIKRWIVATSNIRVGDVVRSHVSIPLIPVNPTAGDAYPIGALPVGASICLIELRPGEGAIYCRSAGASATIVRRGKFVGDPDANPAEKASVLLDDNEEYTVLIRNNSSRKLLRLLPECMVVAGQVSNEKHNQHKYSKFGEKRWHGIKQRSGLWQRKTGRFGRKIHPIGPPSEFLAPDSPPQQLSLKYTRSQDPEFTRQKERELYAALHPGRQKKIQPVPKPFNGLPHTQPRFCWCSWSSVR
ncbi:unnamed protein product [Calicophoron daubneyi]|uniref:Ribosomal protein L2 n=1 Tax=Calicophoron daubneyi TaxID=300641 RepID=A0AAV2TRS9_CALDB